MDRSGRVMADKTAESPKKPKPKRKTKGKKPPQSAADRALSKLQTDHKGAVRSIFRAAGFHRITGVSDREFTFDNQKTDIDDIYVYENVIVIAEYTCKKSEYVGDHLKNKKHIFDKIMSKPNEFIKYFTNKFPDSANQFITNYHSSKIIFKILYCSRFDYDAHYQINVPGPIYMDYPAVRYFWAVADAIKRSSRFELFHFLDLDPASIGIAGKIDVSAPSRDYAGSILPEAHSHFDDGFKIVTFYADPETLLKTAYVLRQDGWRDSLNLYQRMISKSKIEGIRAYLKKQKRVFINNIIVTLPPEVKPLNDKKETVDTSTLVDTAPVTIKLPDRSNSIGLIDGQHRVFAYHETASDDVDIAALRRQQNLLVTGIIYPEGVTAAEREKFEARLFLEINSTQTNAKSQLKQAIGLVLDPFASESIAARVLSQLAKSGPLAGFVEQHFYDTNKLKTASIVSFALKPLVKPTGTDSLFSIWQHVAKADVAAGKNDEALADYTTFCATTINGGLIAIRKNLSQGRWTTDRNVEKRVLATTYVNSFLISFRLLIEKNVSLSSDFLEEKFVGIDEFDFSIYHSSQYKRMAQKIVETHFP
jgi:DGQHR domain-containing protein